ncbi:hypothetical protein Glove_166g287 [Diversispora epigaea]|uniref:2'-phosphotransferase n=1 Tax=Diversispora epigaea TaxID=1348612 RepID=A0A397IWW0_9GLOM|nr:hypothetical protein Glove_166g287 [Diversispora epigaea]
MSGKQRRKDRNDSSQVKLSKLLSNILRHSAEKRGLEIGDDGFVKLNDLLKLQQFKGKSVEDIQFVVENNDKQRFSLKTENSELYIRANQGHSIEVKDLELEKITDHEQIPTVIHGTYLNRWKFIEKEGLRKMNRNHIHCSIGHFGDPNVKSGLRANCDLFIYINAKKAMEDGIEFYRSSNGVILTSGINGCLKPEYFLKVVNKNDIILFPRDS